ncbi:hypothetical protein O181_043080 [Austropuccinia psidii MF-1]|uniref:Uncharacterized protein n=1 Tax=Austropuccinia psidii MF-1 TaxID=1389203 RepID=A0A9Q3HIT4_9BASI|nr:hypothetical protein [Austropuccinia psidii MF-1]
MLPHSQSSSIPMSAEERNESATAISTPRVAYVQLATTIENSQLHIHPLINNELSNVKHSIPQLQQHCLNQQYQSNLNHNPPTISQNSLSQSDLNHHSFLF